MREIILKKIAELKANMKELEYKHLFHLREDWQILNGQVNVLEEIMSTENRAFRIAKVKDIQFNYDAGLISQ